MFEIWREKKLAKKILDKNITIKTLYIVRWPQDCRLTPTSGGDTVT